MVNSAKKKEYKNILEVDIKYMKEISKKYYVTTYISDGIHDLKGGWYTVNGKIYYDEQDSEKFDYYRIKAYSRKQAKEYYRSIKYNQNHIYQKG